jgi:hypothetical protein
MFAKHSHETEQGRSFMARIPPLMTALLVIALASCSSERSSKLQESSLVLKGLSRRKATFELRLRAGDTVVVRAADSWDSSRTPKTDLVCDLTFEFAPPHRVGRPRGRFSYSGLSVAAFEVVFLDEVQESNGRFVLGTYQHRESSEKGELTVEVVAKPNPDDPR